MKPKNIANWLKTHLERAAKHLTIPEIKEFVYRLNKVKEEKIKNG